MKKFIITIAALTAAVSCTMEIDAPVPQENNEVRVEFKATVNPQTKALLDGLQVKWEPGDSFGIIDDVSNKCNVFTSTNTEPASTATFIGTLPGSSKASYAIYPYDAKAGYSVNNQYVFIPWPNIQSAPAGGVNKKAMVLTAEPGVNTVEFKPYVALLKFTIEQEDIASFTMQCNGLPYISTPGNLTIKKDGSWNFANAQNHTKTITLKPAEGTSFQKGKDYYMAVLPASYGGGVIFTFTNTSGLVALKYSFNPLTVKSGDVMDMGTVSGLVWSEPSDLQHSFTGGDPIYNNYFGTGTLYVSVNEQFNLGSMVSLTPSNSDQRLTYSCDNADISVTEDGVIYATKGAKGTVTIKSVAYPWVRTSVNISTFALHQDGVYYFVDGETASVGSLRYNSSYNDSYKGDIVIKPEITIGDRTFKVTKINSNAFAYNSELTSVTVPEGVESIGYYAFDYCPKLKDIYLPKSLKTMNTANTIFQKAEDLVVHVAEGSQYFVTKGDMFYKYVTPGKPDLMFVWMPENKEGDVVFDENTVSFASFCFYYVRKAASFEFPPRAGYVWYAFRNAIPDNFVLKFNYPSYDAFVAAWTESRVTSEYTFSSKATKAKITLSVPASTTDEDLAKYNLLGFKQVIRRTE